MVVEATTRAAQQPAEPSRVAGFWIASLRAQ